MWHRQSQNESCCSSSEKQISPFIGGSTKQIRMCPGAHKAELIPIDSINQQPVRFEMAFTAVLEKAFERMVLTCYWQLLPICQQADNSLQLVQVLATSAEPFDVSFELGVSPDSVHESDPKVLKQRFRRREHLSLTLSGVFNSPNGLFIRHAKLKRESPVCNDLAAEKLIRFRSRKAQISQYQLSLASDLRINGHSGFAGFSRAHT